MVLCTLELTSPTWDQRHGTRKGAVFEWSTDCQQAFDTLKKSLTVSSVLVYPNFAESFRLETNVCVKGLGAVL